MRTLTALYSGRKTKSESFEPVVVEWRGTEGRELGGTGAGEGGKREAGSGRTGGGKREAGLNILKAVVCCLLLGIIQLKNLYSKSFEISI